MQTGAGRARTSVRAALLLPLCLGACEGEGSGRLGGHLFLRGCPDSAEPPVAEANQPSGMPTPLPPFELQPTFFAAEPMLAVDPQLDPRGVNRLQVRLQRGSLRPERTDVFLLYLVDVDHLPLGTPLPVTPPRLDEPVVPLPSQSQPLVRAALLLRGTCRYARVEPMLQGQVRINKLGLTTGDELDMEILSLAVQDPRGKREGKAPADWDAAGDLSGWFQMRIQRGPASITP